MQHKGGFSNVEQVMLKKLGLSEREAEKLWPNLYGEFYKRCARGCAHCLGLEKVVAEFRRFKPVAGPFNVRVLELK